MLNKKAIISLFLLFASGFIIANAESAPTKAPAVKQLQTNIKPEITTTSLNVVANPSKYLNETVIMTAKFDKFTTLGLDYKKAMRDSQKYIGLLVQRDDIKDHNVPLSELKMFMTRDYAEKFIDLNTGDKVKIRGKVFSTALGDAWIDVLDINIIEKAPSTK